MPEVSNLFVVLMGIGTVFFGLVCIVFLTMGMSALLKGTEKPAAAAPAAAAASAAPAAADVIPNRQAMIAAISAAIAEEEGTDLTGIRIRSIKKL